MHSRNADETSDAFPVFTGLMHPESTFWARPFCSRREYNRLCADIFVSNQLIFKDFSPRLAVKTSWLVDSLVGLECDGRVQRPGQGVTLPNERDEPLKILTRVNRQIPEVEINS